MLHLRRAADRGHADHGWLDSRHTFSFADYHDPRHMGFGALRVINDDRVAPGRGFGQHPHRDMEIISYVLDGALGHKDSMGNGSVIRPGDVQIMSAGTGVVHSEMNASPTEPVRFLQIWIIPRARGGAPSYAQRHFPTISGLQLVASGDPADGVLTVGQDVRVHRALLSAGERVEHVVLPGRRAWLQVARGGLTVLGQTLTEGDGLAVDAAATLDIEATGAAELLLFDLA